MEMRRWNRIASMLAFAVLYMFTYWTSDVFRLPETGSTPWNPEAGLAVALACFLGWRSLPLLALVHCACLMIWAPFSSPEWTALLASGHMTALVAVVTVKRGSFTGITLPGSNTATQFVAATALVTAASALVQMGISSLATDWSAAKILRFGMTVSVGNMVGILTVVPLLVQFPRFRALQDFARNLPWGGALLLVVLVATCAAVFGIPDLDKFKFFYLVFVPVIALALRDGLTGAVIAALAASACMIAVLSFRDYNAAGVAELQFLMIVLSVTSLVLGAVTDERERIHGESVAYLTRLQETEAALMRASRISLASEMVAAVSHELAQPLSAARSHIRALRRRLALPRRNRDSESLDIDNAVKQIDSAASTIRDMREFLRRGDAEKVALDLGHVVTTAVDLVQPELRRADISLHLEGFGRLPPAIGNRTQIAQVLLNLVRNARDALSESDAHARNIVIAASLQRPGFLEVSVTDNGPGVSDNLRPRLFTPLHSSKPEGLGLGLSLSNSIITAHGGALWYDEGYAKGTRFAFTLPLADRHHHQGGRA